MSLTPLPPGASLSSYSHLRVGGTAATIYAPANLEEMQRLMPRLDPENTVFLGGGSNLLLPPHTACTVVLDHNMPSTLVIEGNLLYASSSCPISRIIAHSMEAGLGGIEFVAGLPAHLGGLLSMNAGAWGKRIGAFVREVSVIGWDGKQQTLSGDEVEWGYRRTSLRGFIVTATLALEPTDPVAIREAVEQSVARRRSQHPMDLPSLGCFFKNPEGDSAGKLIDESGLKGLRVGDAQVSDKHANFIVNVGEASYADMIELADRIRRVVHERTGIWLEPEVRIIPPAGGGASWN
ncbi:MAG: UDP-N-acetylmuramate dehydrogenase [Candidatus Cloacimonetes bacterium]|nr:UDP-N-acetylmuramate dehydrogenase [Candidatus Cloacimonadota bacterium]